MVVNNLSTDISKRMGPTIYWVSVPLIMVVVLMLLVSPASAWPTEAQWNVVVKNGTPYQEFSSDVSPASTDIIGTTDYPAVYMFNNGSALFFRMRLRGDPGTPGNLAQFSWGVEIDTDGLFNKYAWLFQVDGINESVDLCYNSKSGAGGIGHPSDSCDPIMNLSYPTTKNTNVSYTGIHYFLDWYIPYQDFKNVTKLNDYSPITVFFGTSSSTKSLNKDILDGLPGSALADILSDITTPMCTTTTNGTLNITDSSWSSDVTYIQENGILYIKVSDADRNTDSLSNQTLNITVNASSGDVKANLTLYETNKNTGIFTGSISTSNLIVNTTDNIMQILLGGTITATYNDTNVNGTYSNRTKTVTILDLIPPASIINLNNITYKETYINWTWLDPINADFANVSIWIDNIFKTNVTKGIQYYNATGFSPNTQHTISTRTQDTSGNVNTTWVNATNRTKPDLTPPIAPTITVPSNGAILNISTIWVNGTISSDTTNITIYVNGTITNLSVSVTAPTYNISVPLVDGAHEINVTSQDAAGNVNTTNATVTVTVDTTAPTVFYVNSTHANGTFTTNEIISVSYTSPSPRD